MAPAELAEFLADKRLNALAIGPGVGVGRGDCANWSLAALARRARRGARRRRHDQLCRQIRQRLARGAQSGAASGRPILTPHEGEFSRYFGALDEQTKVRIEARKSAACGPDQWRDGSAQGRRYGGRRAGRPRLDRGQCAGLISQLPAPATSSTGIVAGLLAQGMPAFEAAAAAVWLHGEAAAAFGPGLISEDLPEALAAAFMARCWRKMRRLSFRLPSPQGLFF